MIEFKNASVTYRGGVKALKNIDLRIDDGEFIVIVGLSGAGKSTLLRAVNGLVPATEGSVKVDGKEVVGASAKDLRKIRSVWTESVTTGLPTCSGSLALGSYSKPIIRAASSVSMPMRGPRL